MTLFLKNEEVEQVLTMDDAIAGMETAIALTPGVEKGREVKVPDIVDESFIKELDQQGFYRTLYKK